MRRTVVFLMLCLSPLTVTAAEPLNLENHRGNVVVLDFWASWCIPCRRSFPWMDEMHRKYADEGLQIIAVNLDRKIADAESFLMEYPVKFAIRFDPDGVLAREYKVEVMPSSIILDRSGNIIERHTGFKVRRQDAYEAAIREALELRMLGNDE